MTHDQDSAAPQGNSDRFDDRPGKVRVYQCFVCGVTHETFEEFKAHLTDTHEEGRDFVRCPLSRCGAPVRDVRLHYKAKHPHESLPKAGQYRATVWRDVKGMRGDGRSKKKVPTFKEGYHESTKTGRKIHYRSGYEKEIYELLDVDVEVNTYDCAEKQPIPYIWQGKPRRYLPDILIQFLDGHFELWEVKPANQTMLDKNQAKWDAAAEWARHRGMVFKVVTEKGISKLKKKVRDQRSGLAAMFNEDDI